MPAKILLIGDKEPIALRWTKAAMFRADDIGVYSSSGLGYARAVKYVWAMAPDSVRSKYPRPDMLADVIPPLSEVGSQIDLAIKESGEAVSAKNVFGSTNGPSPSSSSDSEQGETTGN